MMNIPMPPMSKKEWKRLGGKQPDFILVTADAYVDHPAFANGLIARYLQALGYEICVIAQPSYRDAGAYQIFGEPKYAFLVSGGNMDSMVNHYTANKAPRKQDLYSPGGVRRRPDRAVSVYTTMLRKCYPDVAIIIGGIEASLRRFAHYDYWEDKVKPSILCDAPADLLIYGMGERPLLELAEGLSSGLSIQDLTYIRGTAYLADQDAPVYDANIKIPSFEEICRDKRAFARAFRLQYEEQDWMHGKTILQPHGEKMLVQNPPSQPLSQEEMDFVYELPYTRAPHPSYQEPVPALSEVQFSLVSSRGCFGGCSFCSIFFHQGKYIQSRSKQSLLKEAKRLTQVKGFKGYIHDVGGATANFFRPSCAKAEKQGMCKNRRCLAPTPCPNLIADHSEYLDVLESIRKIEGIKKVFIRSGLRYDYIMKDSSPAFLNALAAHYTSGELKVAPEHASPKVLRLMGKPDLGVFEKFCSCFLQASKRAGKKQYVLPYFIASHPGATLKDAILLAQYLKKYGFIPDQVQDFYPTPGSLSTCMYYTGLDPLTMQSVHVPKSKEERKMQRALLQFQKPENYFWVKHALQKEGRTDLIGKGKNALIPG